MLTREGTTRSGSRHVRTGALVVGLLVSAAAVFAAGPR